MFTIKKDTPITPAILRKAISQNELDYANYKKLHDYYKGEHAIMTRVKEGKLKNNKVMTNHARYITKINVGYLLGNPIEYQTKDEDPKIKKAIQAVQEEYDKAKISNIDSETGNVSSKLGKSYNYVYPVGNDLHFKVIDPINCIIIYDNTMDHAPIAAVIYSREEDENHVITYVDVRVIDANKVTIYSEIKLDADSDEGITIEEEENKIGLLPVVKFRNNAEEEGDYQAVLTLIDAYNTLMSDRVNDKEQLVEAILMLYGFALTPEQLKTMKEERVISVPDPETHGEYVTKEMQEEALEVLRNAIKEDIHKISMTPDLSDKEFAGNSSGVAIKFKLIAFELNTVEKERYFEEALMERFKICNAYLSKLSKSSADVPIHKIDAVFKRKLPQNDFETSQTILNLKGLVSDETLVSQVSFIDDAKKEIEAAKKDALARAEALAEQFGTENPSGVTDKTDQAE